MFATIVQKWNAFKADWQEYQRLRRVAARAWCKLYRLRDKITVSCDKNGEARERRCIKTKLVDVPQLNRVDDMMGGSMSIVPYNVYCPFFKGEDLLDEEVVECGQTDCPCHAANCEYANAAKEYETASARCRSFWGSKSKTK